MTLSATERVTRPFIVDAVVVPDSVDRTLYVKRPEAESGYGLLLWRESHMALMRAQETGWRNGHQTVWAGVAGDSRVTNAVAVPNLKLMFLFPPDTAGKDAYRQLVGAPKFGCECGWIASLVGFWASRLASVRDPHAAQLTEALATAARYGYRPPPLVYSSLRPYRPPVPPKPPTTEVGARAPTGLPVASDGSAVSTDAYASVRHPLPGFRRFHR